MLSKMVSDNLAEFTITNNDTDNLINYVEQKDYVYIRDRPAIIEALYANYRYRRMVKADDEKLHCNLAMTKEPILKKKRAFAYPIGTNLSDIFDIE